MSSIHNRKSPGHCRSTCVECTDAVVDVVTNAIGISVCHAVAATHAEGVELLLQSQSADVGASAFKSRQGHAHAASIKRAHAVVDVVTDAVGVGVNCTSPPSQHQPDCHRNRSLQ